MSRSREKTKQAVEAEFVALARSVFGDKLVSLTLYGSYLKETFTPGVSDVNVLVILGENSEPALRALGAKGSRLMRRNRITPLILSRREFVTSADVFPMEYLDIVETHQVLVGPDVTAELEIDLANLRHQIEHQLRGNLVSLRQLAVAAGRPRLFKKVLLGRELQQWYGRLSAILRGLLRFQGVTEIPSAPAELVAAVNTAFQFESGPIVQLLGCRDGGRGNECPDSLELIDSLLARLTRLVEIVDGLESGGGSSK
jgi:predicted nucleotidyltransferase